MDSTKSEGLVHGLFHMMERRVREVFLLFTLAARLFTYLGLGEGRLRVPRAWFPAYALCSSRLHLSGLLMPALCAGVEMSMWLRLPCPWVSAHALRSQADGACSVRQS